MAALVPSAVSPSFDAQELEVISRESAHLGLAVIALTLGLTKGNVVVRGKRIK